MSRSVIPPGKAGLVVLAAALTPVILRKMRPVTKAVGKGLSRFGEMLIKTAEEPHDPVKTEQAEAPNPEAKNPSTGATSATASKRKSAAKPKSKPKAQRTP